MFDDDKEEDRYPPSLSGSLVEVGECRAEVKLEISHFLTSTLPHLQGWETFLGVVASCGEQTTPWARGEGRGGGRHWADSSFILSI